MESNELQELLNAELSSCEEIIKVLKELQLPQLKPRCCDLTDAGPGVTNYELKFRDAEICWIFDSDYKVCVHRSRGDSGQGEAEWTNSAIGDAVVDGSTIEWEFYKKFGGVTEDDVKKMSVKDYEETRRNKWRGMHGMFQKNW
eukprot:gene10338-11413_t